MNKVEKLKKLRRAYHRADMVGDLGAMRAIEREIAKLEGGAA